jgi:MFS family permease
MYGKVGAFWCLNLGMWLFALGNGTCEAVINPLTATLFPRNKTHWLNILHAGWPLGLILGAVIMLGFKQFNGSIPWEVKLGVFLIPVLIYGLLMFNRPFPKSEAQSAGVPLSGMMKTVGMLGFTIGAAMIGLALTKLLPEVLGPILPMEDAETKGLILRGIGWGAAIAIWAAFAYATNFAWGSWVLAFLYLMHALVGYVELGTDSWITNITKQVLKSGTNAMLAFIWTNVLMFTLRFFAGPIVHKINPIGLLFVSAVLGTLGLYMLGLPFTDSVWPWMLAVTIYGLGKTFYWPTLLGVISERFPKGGALALGLSGGIGMISAGILGGPGIGYKQDYFAVEKLQQTVEGQAAYDRYMARNDKGEPEKTPFPFVTSIFPNQVPPVAGLDNAKLKVFDDYQAILARVQEARDAGRPVPTPLSTILYYGLTGTGDLPADPVLKGYFEAVRAAGTTSADGKPVSSAALLQAYLDAVAAADKAASPGAKKPEVLTTTLESDLITLLNQKKEGRPVPAKLESELTARLDWWLREGYTNATADKGPLGAARLFGAKTALLYTAAVPAALAIGFLLLILYFAIGGGYKQVHLDPEEPPMGEY